MKAGNIGSIIVCISVFIFTSFQLNAQTTTWQGDLNNSWFFAQNWSNGIPDATKEAIIPQVAQGNSNCKVAQLSNGIAKKVTIESGGQLTMQSGSPALTITAQDNDGIHVEAGGTLIVGGTINVNTANANSGVGLLNEGTTNISGNLNISGFDNEGVIVSENGIINISTGKLDVDNVAQDQLENGIVNTGTINITASNGRIFLDDVMNLGILNIGTIESEGIIRVGTNGGPNNIGYQGIFTTGDFTSNGELTIENTLFNGMQSNGNTTLNNLVNISETGANGLVCNGGTILSLGEVNIASGDHDGIHVNEGGNLMVQGTINVNTSHANSGIGLLNQGTTNISGSLNISGFDDEGVIVSENGIINISTGKLDVDNVAQDQLENGIINNGTINITESNGRIFLDTVGYIGIQNTGTIESEGIIRVGVSGGPNNIGFHGVFTTGDFTSNGELTIENTAFNGMQSEGNTTLNNIVKISQTGAFGLICGGNAILSLDEEVDMTISNIGLTGILIWPNATLNFIGHSGTIRIDDTGEDGISVTGGGNAYLRGQVYIGTMGPIGGFAVKNNWNMDIIGSCTTLLYIGDGALGIIS